MNYFWLSIKTIFTILIATSCGAIIARKKILHQHALKDLTNVLVYVILPCLIFSKPAAALVNVSIGLSFWV